MGHCACTLLVSSRLTCAHLSLLLATTNNDLLFLKKIIIIKIFLDNVNILEINNISKYCFIPGEYLLFNVWDSWRCASAEQWLKKHLQRYVGIWTSYESHGHMWCYCPQRLLHGLHLHGNHFCKILCSSIVRVTTDNEISYSNFVFFISCVKIEGFFLLKVLC